MKMKHEKLVCAMAVVWIIAIWCAEGGEAMRMMSNSWSNNANVNVRDHHGHSNSRSNSANVNVRAHVHPNSRSNRANVNVRVHAHSNSNSDWRGRFGSVKRRVPTGSNPLHNRSYMDRVHFDSERH